MIYSLQRAEIRVGIAITFAASHFSSESDFWLWCTTPNIAFCAGQSER